MMSVVDFLADLLEYLAKNMDLLVKRFRGHFFICQNTFSAILGYIYIDT